MERARSDVLTERFRFATQPYAEEPVEADEEYALSIGASSLCRLDREEGLSRSGGTFEDDPRVATHRVERAELLFCVALEFGTRLPTPVARALEGLEVRAKDVRDPVAVLSGWDGSVRVEPPG